jgi:OTU-like cysteine protease.
MKRLTATYFHFSVGNCLFDSISYLADEWNGNGKGLRASAIAWAKSEYSIGISDWCSRIKSHFSDTLIDEDLYGMMTYLDYLTKLEDPAVYATSIDIFMISNFLKANIVIYSNSEHPNREFFGLFWTNVVLVLQQCVIALRTYCTIIK